jgi:predicted DNA-binding transcriptional regulator YafY
VLPSDLRDEADAAGLIVGPSEFASVQIDLAQMRDAIRRERKVTFDYEDSSSRASRRTVWPFALAYFDRVHVLAAWCEMRRNYRHFRIDRMSALLIGEERYPRRRTALLKDWREGEGVPAQ